MTDVQIALLVLLSLTLPLIAIALPIVVFTRRANNRRALENMCQVEALVVNVERRVLHSIYNTLDSDYNFYTVKYVYAGVEYVVGVCEVNQPLCVGDTLEVWVNPNKPDRPYADGAVENTSRGLRRVLIVCFAIVGWFVLLVAVSYLMTLV